MGFTALVDELKGTTSKIDKEYVLKRYIQNDFVQYLLRETYDPNRLHNVVIKSKDIPASGNHTLEEVEVDINWMFHNLSYCHSSIENKATVSVVMRMLKPDDQDALMGVINKNLRCGISIKTINNVELIIEVTPIQLANKYDPKKKYKNEFWFVSNKLDGQRIFGFRREDGWHLHSRAGDFLGNEVFTLEHWKPELERLYTTYGTEFTDGEAYRHGMRFEQIQSLVGSTVNAKDTSILQYHIFYGKRADEVLAHGMLSISFSLMKDTLTNIKFVDQTPIKNDVQEVYEFLNRAVEDGYEGVVLRSSNEIYNYKRSDSLLKVKKSDISGTVIQADVEVFGIDVDEFVVRENGVESIEMLPVALHVNQEDGRECKVGSGFSLQDRRDWKEDPDLVVGKVIEVEFQGYGSNGKMRFPVYKRTRNDL